MKALFIIMMSSISLTVVYVIFELLFPKKYVQQINGKDRIELEFMIRESEELETIKLQNQILSDIEESTKIAIESSNKIIENTEKLIAESKEILKQRKF